MGETTCLTFPPLASASNTSLRLHLDYFRLADPGCGGLRSFFDVADHGKQFDVDCNVCACYSSEAVCTTRYCPGSRVSTHELSVHTGLKLPLTNRRRPTVITGEIRSRIVSRRLKISSHFLLGPVDPSFCFLTPSAGTHFQGEPSQQGR